MTLRLLPQHIINRIAAGEVVERPASVVKELVENAIDAEATAVNIRIHQSGRNLIRIEDNGKGMDKDDVGLCLERHATSKLPDDDLWNISFMGFRGEALASISSVARVTVTSKTADSPDAWAVSIEGGHDQTLKPAARAAHGTVIEVKDLFFATPARLKFLKHDRTEQNKLCETVYRQALAHPGVAFTLENEQKTLCDLPVRGATQAQQLRARLDDIIEPAFGENALEMNYKSESGYTVTGYAGLPTYHRSNANHLYLFVNNRPVKDKLLHSAVRAAYQDYLPRMRFPVAALFLDLPVQDVDVNVHPAKIEVRFKHDDRVRAALIKGLREALRDGGFRTSTTIAATALQKAQPSAGVSPFSTAGSLPNYRPAPLPSPPSPAIPRYEAPTQPTAPAAMREPEHPYDSLQQTAPAVEQPPVAGMFLGTARCQLHDNYIIAQTDDAINVIDQHAAHERLRYERLKHDFRHTSIAVQSLLIPEIIELGRDDFAAVSPHCTALSALGLDMAPFGERGIMVRGLPAILGECDIQGLICALADDIREYGQAFSLQEHVDEILSFIACRGAVRSGNRLKQEEMDALLREMECTPYSGQCNHGRPTYVTLQLSDIEKLFGRT